MFSWGTGLCGQLGQSVDRINKIHKFYQIGIAQQNNQGSSKEAQPVEKGPARYDYDENAQIQNTAITEKKAWLPFVPYPLTVSDQIKFKQVSCGSHHTVAVTTSGEVYACGLTTRGRIGLNQDQIRKALKIGETE